MSEIKSMAAIVWPEGWQDGPLVGFKEVANGPHGVIATACTDQGTNLWLLVGDGFTMFGRFTCGLDGESGPWEEHFVGDVTPAALDGWVWVCGLVEPVRTAGAAAILADDRPSPSTGGEGR